MPRGETRAFYCDPPLVGKYITINIRGSYQVLALCEVEVYLSELRSKFQEIDVIHFTALLYLSNAINNLLRPYCSDYKGTIPCLTTIGILFLHNYGNIIQQSY